MSSSIIRTHHILHNNNFNFIIKNIKIVEVGPRDGLQNYTKKILPPQTKAIYINNLQESGLKYIEIGSFVSDKIIQMKSTAQVMGLIHRNKDVKYIALVPNLKYAKEAFKSGVNELSVFTTISETFCQKNNGCNIDDNLMKITEIVKFANLNHTPVRAYISCVFGCQYEGYNPGNPILTARLAKKLYDLGCYEISIADTIGTATHDMIVNTVNEVKKYVPIDNIAIHLHDPDNKAENNLISALSCGIRVIDCSTGEIGGCPNIKNPAINISTEKVIGVLNTLNIKHDINYNKLQIASKFIKEEL